MMVAIKDNEESFTKFIIYSVALTIAFICVSFLLICLSSCTPQLQEMFEKDKPEFNKIIADDLRDSADIIDAKEKEIEKAN